MATRGGTPSDHARAAHLLLDRAPVLVVAEIALPEGPEVVGWPGATRILCVTVTQRSDSLPGSPWIPPLAAGASVATSCRP